MLECFTAAKTRSHYESKALTDIEGAMDQINLMTGSYGWLASAFGILLLTGIFRYAASRVLAKAQQRADKTANVWDDALIAAMRKPVNLGIWIVGISLAIDSMGLHAQAEIFTLTNQARDVAVVWLLIWFAVNFTENVERGYVEGKHGDKVDATTAAAIAKLLRAAIIIAGVLMALQAFGFSISGVLALGGVGGIAIGFAARSLLANFFGALMIFLDRPFSVGDWIRSPDRSIEGTVEFIGWRVTQIRTFDQRPLYVPNSVFTEVSVENPSRMHNRRIFETFGIRYDDLPQMQGIVADVHAMLLNHQDIAQDKTLMVNFVTFGASSLDFFVYTFTKTTDWSTFNNVKQDVLLRIADIVAEHQAEFAFPTQTLQLQTPEALQELAMEQRNARSVTSQD
ncbi:MAG: mechanosensitive ion channel family protein [Pseudomonadales bacterium]|nr:mechanosensitive ion channel family protein [Pseudomonadales bacterium]